MDKILYRILVVFLGWSGIHQIYRKNYLLAIVYFLTFGFFMIGWFYDIYKAFTDDSLYCDHKKVIDDSCLSKIDDYGLIDSSLDNGNNLVDSIEISTPNESHSSKQEQQLKFSKGKFYDEKKIIKEEYIKYSISEELESKVTRVDNDNGWPFDLLKSIEYKDKYLRSSDYVAYISNSPSFKELSENDLEYYLYWRYSFMNDVYVRTTSSYVLLFVYELVNYGFTQNLPLVLSLLDRVSEKYKYYNINTSVLKEGLLLESGYYDKKTFNGNGLELYNYLSSENCDFKNINLIFDCCLNDSKVINFVSKILSDPLLQILFTTKFSNSLLANKEETLEKWFIYKELRTKIKIFDDIPLSLDRGYYYKPSTIIDISEKYKTDILKIIDEIELLCESNKFDLEPNDENNDATEEMNKSGIADDTKVTEPIILNEESTVAKEINKNKVEITEAKGSDIKEGKYYNKILNDKYIGLKAPKYILDELRNFSLKNEKIDKRSFSLSSSIKYKDCYVDYCDFVSYDGVFIDFKELNHDQLKYYLYWRKEFLNNNYVKTTRSYVRLFAFELANYGFSQDLPFILTTLERIKENYKLLRIGALAIRNDLLFEIGKREAISTIETGDALYTYLFSKDEVENKIEYWLDDSKVKVGFSTQIDIIKNNKNKKEKFLQYSQKLVEYHLDKKINLKNYWFDKNVRYKKQALFNSVPMQLERMMGRTQTIIYNRNLLCSQQIVGIAMMCLGNNEAGRKHEIPYDFIEEQTQDTVKILHSDNYYDANSYIDDQYKSYSCPIYIINRIEMLSSKDSSNESFDLNESISLRNCYVEQCDFVNCTNSRMSFKSLNEKQLLYYLYWRKEVLNNHYLLTTPSYIKLFIQELVNYGFTTNLPLILTVMDNLISNYSSKYHWKILNDLKNIKEDLIVEAVGNSNYKTINNHNKLYETITENKLEISDCEIWFIDEKFRKNYMSYISNIDNIYIKESFKSNMIKLCEYYKREGIDYINLWFRREVINKDRTLFSDIPLAFDRKSVTYNDVYIRQTFKLSSDILEVIKLTVDILNNEANNKITYYLPTKYLNDRLNIVNKKERSESLTLKGDNSKGTITSSYLEDYNVNFKKLTIDDEGTNKEDVVTTSAEASTIKLEDDIKIAKENGDPLYDIKYVDLDLKKNSDIRFSIDEADKDFLRMFIDNRLAKSAARKYCLSKGKMVNAYVSNLNQKYFDFINSELIFDSGDSYELSFDIKGELNR